MSELQRRQRIGCDHGGANRKPLLDHRLRVLRKAGMMYVVCTEWLKCKYLGFVSLREASPLIGSHVIRVIVMACLQCNSSKMFTAERIYSNAVPVSITAPRQSPTHPHAPSLQEQASNTFFSVQPAVQNRAPTITKTL